MQPTCRISWHTQRIRTPSAMALAFGLALTSPSTSAAQDSTSAARDTTIHAAGIDSVQTQAATAACAKLTLWEQTRLQEVVDSITTQLREGKIPQPRFDLSATPDSIRPIVTAAGPSCKPIPNPMKFVQERVQAQIQESRPVIGVELRPLSPRDTAGLGLSELRGEVVTSLTPGYGAQAAGIVVGDVIVGLNGKPVKEFLQQAVPWHEGDVVAVDVVHKGGIRQTFNIVAKMSK